MNNITDVKLGFLLKTEGHEIMFEYFKEKYKEMNTLISRTDSSQISRKQTIQ